MSVPSRTRVLVTLLSVLAGAALSGGCGKDTGQDGRAAPTPLQPASVTAAPQATPTEPAPAPVTDPAQYAGTTNWLCYPGKTGTPCTDGLDSTTVGLDGKLTLSPFTPASNPRVDCIYVYPTVSADAGVNSDLEAGAAERNATASQAAQLGSVCRLFVPVYRQLTVASISNGGLGSASARDLAYGDVLAAWKHYLSTENRGRGVVLIGHSQGATHLTRLIREEIDPKPEVRARLVSALLLGTSVQVPEGKDVGGDFANIPACRKTDQVGCVVSYSSYAASSPPPVNGLFGRRSGPGSQALCVNPAALGGGSGGLHPYVRAGTNPLAIGVTTPYVSFTGVAIAQCVNDGAFSYLKVMASPALNWPAYSPTAEWGLHLYDAALAMGDIVVLVGKQAAAFGAR